MKKTSKNRKPKQPRNWLAVSAQFRNSAGALKEKPSRSKRDIHAEIMEGVDEMRRRREDSEEK